jgi:phage tail sheath protein FI
VLRNGIWAGVTPEEAFFIKADESTMTSDDIDNGRFICLIGVAVARPAEFITFTIVQKKGTNDIK